MGSVWIVHHALEKNWGTSDLIQKNLILTKSLTGEAEEEELFKIVWRTIRSLTQLIARFTLETFFGAVNQEDRL